MKENIIASLKIVRKRICSYGASHGSRCDCKFGIFRGKTHHIGSEESGCPEMYTAISMLENMTPTEEKRIFARMQKEEDRKNKEWTKEYKKRMEADTAFSSAVPSVNRKGED